MSRSCGLSRFGRVVAFRQFLNPLFDSLGVGRLRQNFQIFRVIANCLRVVVPLFVYLRDEQPGARKIVLVTNRVLKAIERCGLISLPQIVQALSLIHISQSRLESREPPGAKRREWFFEERSYRIKMRAAARMAALMALSLGGTVPAGFAQSTTRSIVRAEDPAEAEGRATIAKAEAAMERKDFAGAVQICADFLDKNPDNAAVHFQLGYAYTALGKSDDAEAEYRSAIELDPKMGPAYLNLGLTLLDSDPEEAVSSLKQASELMPGQPQPKYALGMALAHAGKDDAAIEQFHDALKLDERNFSAQFELARTLLHARRFSEAELEFHRAVDLQPNSGAAHLGLVQTLLAEKKSVDAATELERYLQTNPKDVEGRIERASILIDVGKNEEALAELDRAATLRPETASTLKMRSVIQFRLKNYDAALAALKQILSLIHI